MAEKRADYSIEILDRSGISPPQGCVPTTVIPLSFFDIPWILFNPVKRLMFYAIPHYSVLQFTETALPSLKRSLSLALQGFFPLAGSLFYPPPPGKPHIVYSDGDSVSFTAAVSAGDFDELTSDRPQAVPLVHPLLLPLPPSSVKDGVRVAPLLGVQVTLFPDRGICIGTQLLHVAADGTAFTEFLKTWASICMAELQGAHIDNPPCPVIDRSVVKDQDGLEPILLKDWAPPPEEKNGARTSPPRERVRATFPLSRAQIDRLKSRVLNQLTNTTTASDSEESLHISTFVVVCAYTWVCLIKSKGTDEIIMGGQSGCCNSNLYHFGFTADCRSRLGYPIPKTYFGNCLTPGLVPLKGDVLVGTLGVASAARALGAKVKELSEGGGALRCLRTWRSDMKKGSTNLTLTVAGSPRQRVYETNFGWGMPRKALMVHIEASECISLFESRDGEGGVEIGLALDKVSMGTFSTLFQNGLDSF